MRYRTLVTGRTHVMALVALVVASSNVMTAQAPRRVLEPSDIHLTDSKADWVSVGILPIVTPNALALRPLTSRRLQRATLSPPPARNAVAEGMQPLTDTLVATGD